MALGRAYQNSLPREKFDEKQGKFLKGNTNENDSNCPPLTLSYNK